MALTAAAQVEIDADLAALHEKHQDHDDFLPVLSSVAGLIAGYVVLPHVQRFADAARKATGVQSIGTYPGHSPSLDRALDLFHAVGDVTLAAAISQFAIDNQERYGVRYVIDRQRIWHRLDPVWRWMEDRGDNTQNHYDHDHVSFELTAAPATPDVPVPPAPPTPVLLDKEALPMSFTYIADGEDFVYLGTEGFHGRLPFGDTLNGLKAGKQLADLGHQTGAFHAGVVVLANTLKFIGDRS